MEFFDLKSVEEARSLFLAAAGQRSTAEESLPLIDAVGRAAARPIRAGADLPGFARSTVDGFAVRAADTFGASEGLPAYLRLQGEILMGQFAPEPLRPGMAWKISTGGALPEGADAVVMVEHTEALVEDEIGVRKPVSPGENVVQRDEDCPAGGVLVEAGQMIRAQEVALLQSAGVLTVPVHRRPRVAIISTGDELVAPNQEPCPGQVRESNAAALAVLVRRDGGEPHYLGLARDDEAAIRSLLLQGMQDDVVLISGGSSVGTRDLTARLISELGAPGILVHGVKLKPGKPTILAVAGNTPVAGLPGHPVSAQVSYGLFITPLLRQLQGLPPEPAFRPTVQARMTKNVASAPGRTDCVRVRLIREGDGMLAEPVHGKSSLISTLVRADGLVIIPSAKEGVLAGELVEVELLV